MHLPSHAKDPMFDVSIACDFIKGEFQKWKSLRHEETGGASSLLSIVVSNQCVYRTFCIWCCRSLNIRLLLHYRKNPHVVGRKQLNNKIPVSKKKKKKQMSWQLLASKPGWHLLMGYRKHPERQKKFWITEGGRERERKERDRQTHFYLTWSVRVTFFIQPIATTASNLEHKCTEMQAGAEK